RLGRAACLCDGRPRLRRPQGRSSLRHLDGPQGCCDMPERRVQVLCRENGGTMGGHIVLESFLKVSLVSRGSHAPMTGWRDSCDGVRDLGPEAVLIFLGTDRGQPEVQTEAMSTSLCPEIVRQC